MLNNSLEFYDCNNDFHMLPRETGTYLALVSTSKGKYWKELLYVIPKDGTPTGSWIGVYPGEVVEVWSNFLEYIRGHEFFRPKTETYSF